AVCALGGRAVFPIRTILCPTDFSNCSANALQLASSLARDHRARLVILHVIPRSAVTVGEALVPPQIDKIRAEARERLDALPIRRLGLLAERRLADGDPAEVILHFARENSAELIVMGTHAQPGLNRVLMGSVAERVVRNTPCPVLTVTTPSPRPA